MIELLFTLRQDEEDWPPVAVEGLWCEPSEDYFRVETCPLFVKGLSIGDTIDVQQDERGRVESFEVVTPSENSTVWLMFWDRTAIDSTLRELRSIGCDTSGPLEGMEAKVCSANVPASVAFAKVDALLEPLEQSDRVAVAHPSHRHPDC